MSFDKFVPSQASPSRFDTQQTITLDSTGAIRGVIVAYGLSIVAMALASTGVLPDVFTAPFVVLLLTFVPGALLLIALARRDASVDAEHVLYAFGSSLLILTFVGVLVNILLPLVGVTRPLMPVPLGAGVTVAVVLLAAVARWRNPDGTVTLRIPPLRSPVPLAFLLLPLLSIVGVNLINATGINVLLILVLLAVGAVPLVAVQRLDDRWYSLAIWTTAVAILYHKSLWKYAGFGGRPHGITAWEAGRWSPGTTSIRPYSSELLQNGVLFPLFARLSDLFIMTQYEVVNPFFVSFIPLAMYVTFRRYVRTDVAFLGAAIFAFAHPFYYQYPTAGRAATPVLFLALFGVALSNEGLTSGKRAALALSFLVGVVVTHYGTSYYVAAAFSLSIVILYSLWVADYVVGDRLRHLAPVADGGIPSVERSTPRRSTIFSPTTVSYFIAAALGWYLYTRQGWKFELLPKHVYDNIRSLILGSTGGGRTTARVTENYTSPSIQIGKYIYVLLAVLILIGLAVVFYRRLVTKECSFDDHYLAIATALFGIFGTTTILANWGGGRPMMITFSFTTVFAVLGAEWLANITRRVVAATSRLLSRISTPLSGIERRIPEDPSIGVRAFASLLFVFFLLNSGVAAATLLDGLAPSNVPAQPSLGAKESPQSQVTVHREIDIETHVWFVEHLDPEYGSHADTFGIRQYDWYRPDVGARTPSVGGGYPSGTSPVILEVDRQRNGSQPGYLLLMGHNVELGAVWTSKFLPEVPLEDLALDRQNLIYTSGETRIYFEPGPGGNASEASAGSGGNIPETAPG